MTSSPSGEPRHLATLNSWFLLFNSPLVSVYLSSCGKKKPRGTFTHLLGSFLQQIAQFSGHILCNLAFCPYIRFSFLQFPIHVPHFLLGPHWQCPQTPHFDSQSIQGNLGFLYHASPNFSSLCLSPGSKATPTFLRVFGWQHPISRYMLYNKLSQV